MKKLMLCIAVMLLTMLLTSCVSNEVVYVDKPYIPDLDFPTFPVLEGGEDNGNSTVTVSSDWILRLAEYKIRIEETEKKLQRFEGVV